MKIFCFSQTSIRHFTDFSVYKKNKWNPSSANVTCSFQHDIYSSHHLKLELQDLATSISYNSNCLGMLSETNRFMSRVLLLSHTVNKLESGKNPKFDMPTIWNLRDSLHFRDFKYGQEIFDKGVDELPRFGKLHSKPEQEVETIKPVPVRNRTEWLWRDDGWRWEKSRS